MKSKLALRCMTLLMIVALLAPGKPPLPAVAQSQRRETLSAQIMGANWDSCADVTDEPPPGPAGSTESMTVSGLTPGRTYYFALKAQDEVGSTSGLSNSVSAQAGGDVADRTTKHTIARSFAEAPTTSTQVIATISVGDQPRAVAFSPDSTLAFVSHAGEATIKVIRVSDHTVIDTIIVGETTAGNLLGLDVTPDGQYIYVAWRNRNVVVPIRTSDWSVLPEIPVSLQPMALSITPDGTRVYVVGEGGVDVIQISTNTVVDHIDSPSGALFLAVVVSPDGMEAYINDNAEGKVYIVSTLDNAIIDSVPVGRGPHHDIDVTPDGAMVYTSASEHWNPTGGKVEAIRLSDRHVEHTDVGGGVSGVAVTPDGQYVFVSAYDTNRVSIIRVSDNSVLEHIPVGNRPDGIIDISPDGRWLYVPNGNDDTVSVIAVRDGANDTIVFTEHVVGSSFGRPYSVFAADVDSDGDVDVLATAENADDIAWWENDGSQNFTQHIIDGNFNGAAWVHATDVDGDGDVDVVGAATSGNQIAWWENDGSENFTKHTIDSSFHRPHWVHATDVDDDADVDVLGTALYGDEIAWWENDGNENFAKHTIAADFNGPLHACASDLDSDGDIDVVAAAIDGDTIAWWENDGSENFSKHIIDGNFDGALGVYAADVDGDQDVDVLGAALSAGEIAWWENDGSENFTKRIIAGGFTGASTVHTTDMDSDGDVDVVGGGYGIAWWENDGSENFTQHMIPDGFGLGQRFLYPVDVDGDWDIDVLAAVAQDDVIAWYESMGGPVDTVEVDIITPLPGSTFYHGGSMPIKAAVTFGGAPVTAAQVSGRITLDASSYIPLDLYDDGAHDDGAADDGIYAVGDFVVYGSLSMPVSGNPYTLSITATADGQAASDTTTINVAHGQGAPAVAVDVTGPSAPLYFAGDEVTITAALSYPDSSTHTDTAVMVTVTRPDLSVQHVSLSNVADDTWQSTYTLPAGEWGRYYFDVRAVPPAGSEFVDGWGASQLDAYLGLLTIQVNPVGTGLLYGTMPLSVCVSADSVPVSGATVYGEITAPVSEDAGVLIEVETTGCYKGSYSPFHSGSHSITYSAQKPGYVGGAQSGSFQVSTESSTLATRIQEFGNSARHQSRASMLLLEESAQDGDYFARMIEADKTKRAVQFIVDLVFLGIEANEVADKLGQEGWKIIQVNKLPGVGYAVESALTSQEAKEELFMEGFHFLFSEGTGDAIGEQAMTLPARYYAFQGDINKDVQRPIKEYVRDEYVRTVPGSNSLEDLFVGTLEPGAEAIRDDIQANTTGLIDNLPPMTQEEETAYIQDLSLRQKTTHWLSFQELAHRSSLLLLSQDRREELEANKSLKLVKFLVIWGLKMCAGALCDGPCILFIDLVQLGAGYYFNSEAIEEDQRMRDLALELMHLGYDGQVIIWSNTNAGLALVKTKTPPESPKGSLDQIDLRRTTAWGFLRDVYADVTITNPPDGVTALYGIKAYYLTEDNPLQVSQNTVDPDSEKARLLVELAPGESKTVRLYLRKHNEFDDGQPHRGDPMRFNLYAYTDKGAYLVDAEPSVPYEPENVSTSAADNAVSIHYLSPRAAPADRPLKLTAGSNVADDARFPLMTRIGSWPNTITYTLAIYAENPFPGPIAAVISQPIPSQVTVIDAGDGVAGDGAIVWHRVIQPREMIDLHIEFEHGEYGTEVIFPGATMQFYDPADDAVISLSSDPVDFEAGIPLAAQCDHLNLQVPSGSDQEVALTVTNLDGSATQDGDLTLQLRDMQGTEVFTTTTHVSLGPGESHQYLMSYTAPDAGGLYTLEILLQYGQDTKPVVHDLVTVQAPEAAQLLGTVTLQGRPSSPNPAWITSLQVSLYEPDGTTPLYTYQATTDENGQFDVSDVPPGNHDIRIKGSHTLSKLKRSVVLEHGANAIDFGTLLEGDANDDNAVMILDYSVLRTAYGTASGQPGYDERADFNQDGAITILDYSLLRTNYGLAGE